MTAQINVRPLPDTRPIRPRVVQFAASLLVVTFCLGSLADAQSPRGRATIDEEYLAIDQAIPGFGGLYFDDENQLTIHVTDLTRRAALSQLVGSEARFVQARYRYSQLYEWRGRLMRFLAEPGVVFLDIDETRNRIHIGVEAWRAAQGREAAHVVNAQYGVPAEAIVLTESTPAVEEAAIGSTLRTDIRPTPGGMQIYSDGGADPAYLCTMGFVARRQSRWGFVTNSHCTNVQGALDGTQYSQPDSSGRPFGTETVDPKYRGDTYVYWGWWTGTQTCQSQGFTCRFSDSAFVELPDAAEGEWGRIAKPACKNCNRTLEIGDLGTARFSITKTGNVAVGKTVHKVGRTTGWTTGKVLDTCVHMARSGNRLLLCQNKVDNFSDSGDSGSPVFRKRDDGTVKLVGIHWGKNDDKSVYSPFDQIETDLGDLDVFP